jgi:uncharacterized repeat protein (TIGR01451 family)
MGGAWPQKHVFIGQPSGGNGYISYGIPPVPPSSDWSIEPLPDAFVQVTDAQFECKIPKADVQMWSGQPFSAWLEQGAETICGDHVQLPTLNLDFSSGSTNDLNVSALVSPAVRPARTYTLWLEYTNESADAMPVPDFVISNDSNTPMGLDKDQPFQTDPIQIPGTETLEPGDFRRIPVFFKVPGELPSHHMISFTVEKVVDAMPIFAATTATEVIRPEDPNVKAASAGVGDSHYVLAGDELSYIISFENKATATAPAQEVFVTDALDEGLDWSTFSLGEVAFGDHLVSALDGSQSGTTQVILNDDLAVDIIVEFDPTNGVVHWTLRTIDRATGKVPEDATVGFLPPNDATGRGEGYVTFSIRTRSDLTAGTSIPNFATIKFDTEPDIYTNQVFNTIGTPIPGIPIDTGISDGAIDVLISTILTWSASEYARSYDLYLWDLLDQQRPDFPIVSELETPFYDPLVDLKYDTTYFWQVVAKNVMGEATGLMWSFTTEAEPVEPVIPEPTTLLLVGPGLLAILALAWRRRQKK